MIKVVSRRLSRVKETLKEKISQIIQKELKDPRIGFVTITSVDVSKDLKYATVFLSILGNDEKRKECLVGFESAKGYIKSELGKRVRIKFLPDLKFEIDQTIDEGIRISKLINQVHKKESNEKSG